MMRMHKFRSPEHIYRLRKVQQMQDEITSEARSPDLTSFVGIMEYWTEIGSWKLDLSRIQTPDPKDVYVVPMDLETGSDTMDFETMEVEDIN
jgi:hypothetical protein